MIGPIRVCVAIELIVMVDEMQSKIGPGFMIPVNSVDGSEMAGEKMGIVSAKCRNCGQDLEASSKCRVHQ